MPVFFFILHNTDLEKLIFPWTYPVICFASLSQGLRLDSCYLAAFHWKCRIVVMSWIAYLYIERCIGKLCVTYFTEFTSALKDLVNSCNRILHLNGQAHHVIFCFIAYFFIQLLNSIVVYCFSTSYIWRCFWSWFQYALCNGTFYIRFVLVR